MEKRTARLFCGFGTFILLLYTVEVSSTPAVQSIMSVMRKDTNICKSSKLLYDSEYMKGCSELEYPSNNKISEYKNADTFLCLGVYDAFYKICNYSSHWRNPFSTPAAFDMYIEKINPGNGKAKQIEFCEQLKNISPIYEKTRASVTLLTQHLNDTFACFNMCFDAKQKLKPLCAILAWSKSVDEEVSKAPEVTDNKKTAEVENKEAHKVETIPSLAPELEKPVKEPMPVNNDDTKTADEIHPENSEVPSGHAGTELSKVTNANAHAENINEKPKTVLVIGLDSKQQKQQNSDVSAPAVSNVKKNLSTVVGTDPGPKQDTSNVPDNPVAAQNSAQGANVKTSVEDTKTSTLSENTQDQEDINNEDEGNHNENGKFSFDVDSVPEQPFETSDQNHNIPEPSKQRDIPHYHNLSPNDESHFFTYFTITSLIFIAAYIGYHNKQKILAIVLEGRRSRNNRGRRRPSTANYRKLDCTLEEAVTSQCNANVTHVIY